MSAVVWSTEYALPVEKDELRREGETSHSQGETSDIILPNESLCYALCLTKSQKNTAIVVCAPQCATEVCVICVHLK